MCINIEIPKTINFPICTNGKLMVLGIPINLCTLGYSVLKFRGWGMGDAKGNLCNGQGRSYSCCSLKTYI